jgi:hypothetical protein
MVFVISFAVNVYTDITTVNPNKRNFIASALGEGCQPDRIHASGFCGMMTCQPWEA